MKFLRTALSCPRARAALACCAVLAAGCSRSEEVITAASAREVDRIRALLEVRGGIETEKAERKAGNKVGWVISVGAKHADRARSMLCDAGLLQDERPDPAALLEDGSYAPSESLERERIQKARGRSIEEALLRWPGVADASVLLYREESASVFADPALHPEPAATASALLVLQQDAPAPEQADVAAFIAAAAGLERERVQVFLRSPAGHSPAFAAAAPGGPAATPTLLGQPPERLVQVLAGVALFFIVCSLFLWNAQRRLRLAAKPAAP